jgi:hypothetical protein
MAFVTRRDGKLLSQSGRRLSRPEPSETSTGKIARSICLLCRDKRWLAIYTVDGLN